MISCVLLMVGETKNSSIATLEQYFLTCAGKYMRTHRHVVAPAAFRDVATIAKGVAEETDRLVAALSHYPNHRVVLLDVDGRTMRSEAFAAFLQQQQDTGEGVVMVIGGAYGVDREHLAPQMFLSLSAMTTTHELVRVFLAEQLYRAGSIAAGARYHHGEVLLPKRKK